MKHLAVVAVLLGAAGCNNDFTLTRPARPDRITVVSGNSDATLYWDEVPGATGYRVYSGAWAGYADPLTRSNHEDRGGERVVADTAVATNLPLLVSPDDPEELYPTAFIVAAIRGNEESEASPEVLGFRQPFLLSEQPVLSLTTTTSGAAFGSAIAGVGDVDGDGFEDVVIGSPNAGGAAGQIALYRGGPAGLAPVPAWTPQPAPLDARRGAALAFSSTFNQQSPTVLVGAPGLDYVEVFSYGAGATLVAGVPLTGSPGSGFGSSVCAAGNFDGRIPAVDEIAVGAPQSAGGGSVFLFRGLEVDENVGDLQLPPSVEVRFASLGLSTSGFPDFGSSLAGGGNLENDAFEDLVVGAPGFDGDRGAIVVLRGADDLTSQAIESAAAPVAGTEPGERFGTSIAFLGDIDDDDVGEVAVGAPRFSALGSGDPKTHQGRVVAFADFPGDTALASAESVLGETAGALLGSSLTFAGAVDPSFRDGLLAGEPGTGSAHLFLPDNPQDGVPNALHSTALRLEDFLVVATDGSAVALAAADVDGDGGSDVLVGLPGADGGSGRVLVYLTLPGVGPRVHAGPSIAAEPGAIVRLSAASFSDTQGSQYLCVVDWGDGTPEDVVSPCTPPALRELPHAFPAQTDCTAGAPALEETCDFAIRVTVLAGDGRSGQGLTRVRVPLTASSP